MDSNVEHLLFIYHNTSRVKYTDIQDILRIYTSLEDAYKDSFTHITHTSLYSLLTDIYKTYTPDFAQDIIKKCKDARILICSCLDERFPQTLLHATPQPLVLYYQGDISLLTHPYLVAIVGSRKPAPYAQLVLKNILKGIKGQDIVTISGMAYGIDAQVHKNSIQYGLKTIAVLGSGIEDSVTYPLIHNSLKQEIVSNGGLVISQFHPCKKSRPYYFPIRNQLVVLLSTMVCVIQAKIKSGSMITVKLALEFGRSVYTIPARLTDTEFEGNVYIISQGASILQSGQDIYDELNYIPKKIAKTTHKLPPDKHIIVDILDKKILTIDEIETLIGESKTDLTTPLLTLLSQMELDGFIESDGVQYWVV